MLTSSIQKEGRDDKTIQASTRYEKGRRFSGPTHLLDRKEVPVTFFLSFVRAL